MLPFSLTTSLNMATSSQLSFSSYSITFRCRLPSPMCPQPSSFPLSPTLDFWFYKNFPHLVMSKEISKIRCFLPTLLQISAMSSRIFQMLRYYFQLEDMMASSKAGSDEKSSSIFASEVSMSRKLSPFSALITEGQYWVIMWQQSQSKNSIALRFFPSTLLVVCTASRILPKSLVLMRSTCLSESTFTQLMSTAVIIPRVPSDPMNSCLRSIPVLSFLMVDLMLRTVPSANTASIPSTLARRGPYLIKNLPPAWVDRFPPIWQDPLAPKSKGTSYPKPPR